MSLIKGDKSELYIKSVICKRKPPCLLQKIFKPLYTFINNKNGQIYSSELSNKTNVSKAAYHSNNACSASSCDVVWINKDNVQISDIY